MYSVHACTMYVMYMYKPGHPFLEIESRGACTCRGILSTYMYVYTYTCTLYMYYTYVYVGQYTVYYAHAPIL